MSKFIEVEDDASSDNATGNVHDGLSSSNDGIRNRIRSRKFLWFCI